MTISMITVSFNSVNTIRATMESVIQQKSISDQYIIIDGGSNDGTVDVVKEYGESIDDFVSEKDRGISDAFNKGICRATCDIVGIINSDDCLLDGALDIVRQEFDEQTDVLFGFVKSGHEFVQSKAKVDNKRFPPIDIKNIRFKMCFSHPAVFIRKAAYEKYGLYDVNLRYSMDRELLLRMYLGGARFKQVNAQLAFFRLGGVSGDSFHKTVRESRDVSIRYGASRFKTFIWALRLMLAHIKNEGRA